jgi:hypothetical protein
MSTTQRKIGGTAQSLLNVIVQHLNHLANCIYGLPAIGNGTTAGRLRTTAATAFKCDGKQKSKASTDNLWNLSAETDTIAAEYRAYWLYVDASGTASIAAGSNAASEAAALAALPARSLTKAVFGVFIAGPETDFDDAGGLAAQGTIYDDVPAGATGEFQSAELVAP